MIQFDVLCYRLQQVNGRLFDAVVEHLTVLVEHQTVSRPVELLVGQTTRLLVVDLVDGVLDGLPVLLGLRALHVIVPHLVTVHVKLVLRQV